MQSGQDAKSRRQFLSTISALPVALSLGTTPVFAADSSKTDEEISPVEDLMREHGLLNRLLLIYDHAAATLSSKRDFNLRALTEACDIVRSFIESYHEKLEEDHVFPHFDKANKLTDLVAILKQQHGAGKAITTEIGAAIDKRDHAALALRLTAFTRMYRPHEAREDTVLFPVFQSLVPKELYRELGEQFEDLEHKLFGKEGFAGMVDKVAAIENQLGIYDLSQFTPKTSGK